MNSHIQSLLQRIELENSEELKERLLFEFFSKEEIRLLSCNVIIFRVFTC